MNPVNLFGLGTQSKSSNLTAAHRLNCYYDIQADNDKTTVAAYGTPGTTLFSTPSINKTYGLHWMESVNKFYVVQRASLYAVNPDGSSAKVFELPNADFNSLVSMANNGTELCFVTGKNAFIYNTVTGITTNLAGIIPYGGNAADTVTFLNGRFIINRPNTGQFFISNLYDGLTWDGLNFATAESAPDNLIAVVADKGNLALLGSSSVELWSDNGDVLFPFSRINAAPSDAGLAARWSLTRAGGYLTGLFRNRTGMLSISILDGYTVMPISGPDIDYIINNYTAPTNAIGFGYALNGRHFYQITFASDNASWLYSFDSKTWSQLKSWGLDRHRAELGASFGNKFIVSDYETGDLLVLDQDAFTDSGNPIEREITGSHVFAKSRNRTTISRLRVDMEGGAGLISGQGLDPQIMLQISRDNGHTWGNELWTKYGKIGEYTHRAEWRRLGMARDWVFKLRVTDPVKFVIISAIIEGKELNK